MFKLQSSSPNVQQKVDKPVYFGWLLVSMEPSVRVFEPKLNYGCAVWMGVSRLLSLSRKGRVFVDRLVSIGCFH